MTSVALTAGFLTSRLPFLTTRRFDSDELEHAHVAWYVLQGEVPFRDFFEHHTPLFHYLLAAFLSFFEPERSADDAFTALFAARHVTWGISVVLVGVTFLLARQLRDKTTAWVAMPIVAGNIVVALRALEIRPDGLSTLLWVGSLVALHAALASGSASPATRRLFVSAGVLVGLAVLTSQKLLLAGPPLAILLTWYVVSSQFGGGVRERLGAVAWQVSGVVAVWVATVALFAAEGAADDFLRMTILDGIGWTTEASASSTLAFVTDYDPWFFALTAAGAVQLVRELREAPARRVPNALLLLASAGLFAGLFVIPVPYPQYCLTFVPLFAIVAASFLVESARRIASAGAWRGLPSVWTAAAVVALSGVGAVGLGSARPEVLAPYLYPVVVATGCATALFLARGGRTHLGLAVVLLLLAVVPAQAMRWMAGVGDRGQFAALRYVHEETPPDGVVLDGWSGYGVFRRHASYYWMLHPGVRAMLTPDEVDRMVTSVVSGRVRPDAIVLDEHLRDLSADLVRFIEFIEAAYEPAGVDMIHRLRQSPHQ